MTKKFDTELGTITVRNVMLEGEFNDLFEGIEFKDEDNNIVEVEGYRDIDEMTADEVVGIFSKYF
jgi:hypothetical protein